jgi:large conductance mechanosensitive channel
MGVLQEFREFAVKGNMIDLAVGVVVGGAFGKIVSSLVGDIIMPPIGLAVGGVDFKNLKMVLKPGEGDAPPVSLNYGAFLQTIFDFLIVAVALFVVVKAINSLRRTEEAAPPPPAPPSNEEVLLADIRDLLRSRA